MNLCSVLRFEQAGDTISCGRMRALRAFEEQHVRDYEFTPFAPFLIFSGAQVPILGSDWDEHMVLMRAAIATDEGRELRQLCDHFWVAADFWSQASEDPAQAVAAPPAEAPADVSME